MAQNYRKFWLVNGLGKEYDLTNLDETAFASSPTGLGASSSMTVSRLGNSAQALSYIWELQPVQFDILFRNDYTNAEAYDEYKKFFDFCQQLPLYLFYKTPDMTTFEYYREVLISSLEKSEVDTEKSTLVCACSLQPLTMWYSSEQTVIEVSSERALGKHYELQRPYHYSAGNLDEIEIYNNSNVTIPMTIEIEGTCENPQYTLMDSNNNQYGVGKFIGTFDYVYVNSDDLAEEIKLKVGEGYLPNPTSYQDLSIGIPNQTYLTFLYLKPYKSVLKMSFTNEFEGKVRISMRENYVTV